MVGEGTPGRTATAYVACALVAAATWAVLPHGVGRDVVALGYAPVAALVLAAGARRKVGPGQYGWLPLLGALLLIAAGELLTVLRSHGHHGVGPWAPPAAATAGATLVLGALVYLSARRGRISERGALIDALIVGIALVSVVWVAVVNGTLSSTEHASVLAFPVAAAIVYLLAAIAATAILIAPGRRHAPVALVVAAVFMLYAGAVVDGWRLVSAGEANPVAGVVFDSLGVALLAASALFPAQRADPGARSTSTRLTPRRLCLLTLVALVPTVVLIARAPSNPGTGEIAVYGASAVVVTVATLLRMIGLLGATRRALAREEVLRRAASALAGAPDRAAIHAVAVESALAFIGDPAARVTLSLLTPNGITVAAAAGADIEGMVGLELPPASLQLARRALDEVSIEVIAAEVPEAGLVSGPGRVTFFALAVGGEGFGLFGVRTHESLGREERAALETLAAQVALALDGMRGAERVMEGRAERRYRALVQHATDLITLVDERMTVRYQSPSIESALGWTVDDVMGSKPLALAHPGDRARILLYWRQVRERPGVHPPIDFRAATRDGGWRTVETTANNLLADPELQGIVLTTRDISDRRELETRLAHQAFHDELTGLANRALFVDRIEHALAVAARESRAVAVLFLDLDDFKEVNDSLGHAAGDRMLVETARRIEACLRQGDTAARLSGDEFGILIERATRESSTAVAERVLDKLREPITIAGRELFLQASVGIALSSTDGDSAQELLRNADTAMYRAKGAGKSAFALFKQSMHAAALKRLELRSELEGAAARGEMSLRYQPIFALGTGTIAGFEALVRWEHPKRGLIAPSVFIPLAEETGAIVPLGAWIFKTALQQLRAWETRWPDQAKALWLSVNVSTRQLAEPELPATLARIAAESGVAPSRIVVELTESVLIADAAEAARQLEALRSLGLRVAIDDFGTGYSSLGVLEQMPVDVLKIASRFVERLGSAEPRPRLVEAVVRLGDTLDLPTVAEGIESAAQLAVLRQMGCEMGQGYFLSRPLRTDRVEGLLARAAAGDPLIVGGPR